MEVPYRFDDVNGIVRFIATPDSSFDERIEAVLVMVSDKELPRRCGVLIDVSLVRTVPSVEQIERLPSVIQILRVRFRGRIALLNSSAGLSTFAYIVAAMTDGDFCQAFVIKRDAIAWLTATE